MFGRALSDPMIAFSLNPGEHDKYLYDIDAAPKYHVELDLTVAPGTKVIVCLNLNDTLKLDKRKRPTWKLSAVAVLVKGETNSVNISPTRRFRFVPGRTTMAQLRITAVKDNQCAALVHIPDVYNLN